MLNVAPVLIKMSALRLLSHFLEQTGQKHNRQNLILICLVTKLNCSMTYIFEMIITMNRIFRSTLIPRYIETWVECYQALSFVKINFLGEGVAYLEGEVRITVQKSTIQRQLYEYLQTITSEQTLSN